MMYCIIWVIYRYIVEVFSTLCVHISANENLLIASFYNPRNNIMIFNIVFYFFVVRYYMTFSHTDDNGVDLTLPDNNILSRVANCLQSWRSWSAKTSFLFFGNDFNRLVF